MTDTKKPVVVYFHRYPIEFEAEQFPATKALMDLLSENFQAVYFSMTTAQKDEKLRRGIHFAEIPLEIDRFKSSDKWLKLLLYYLYLPFTLRKLKRLNPDFIICKETLPFLPSLIVRLKKPTLIDISDWWFSIMFGKTGFGRKMAGLIESKEVADWNKFNVVCVTHTAAEGEVMVKKGMAREKIRLINAPQHEGVYFPTDVPGEREKLGLSGTDWVVAVHGIIHPSKGYDQILHWWADIIKTRPNWKLLIIGGSGEEAKCRSLIASLGIEKNALMTGWLPSHSDVNKALNAADCLLITRRNSPENFGVVPSALFHSLALNKPTVATGLPGLSEIVQDKINGFIFKPDDYESFKSTLELVCDDNDLAKKAALNGIETAKNSFDLNICAQKYYELICEKCGITPSKPS